MAPQQSQPVPDRPLLLLLLLLLLFLLVLIDIAFSALEISRWRSQLLVKKKKVMEGEEGEEGEEGGITAGIPVQKDLCFFRLAIRDVRTGNVATEIHLDLMGLLVRHDRQMM